MLELEKRKRKTAEQQSTEIVVPVFVIIFVSEPMTVDPKFTHRLANKKFNVL